MNAGVVFVLASASSGRASTLRRAGVEPLVLVSSVDEDAIEAKYRQADGTVPHSAAADLVVELARAKAYAVARQLTAEQVADHARQWCPGSRVPVAAAPADSAAAGSGVPGSVAGVGLSGAGAGNWRAIVVGCDSLLASRGRLVGKPHHEQAARERISEQSGQTVVLHTGHCVLLVSGKSPQAESHYDHMLVPQEQLGEAGYDFNSRVCTPGRRTKSQLTTQAQPQQGQTPAQRATRIRTEPDMSVPEAPVPEASASVPEASAPDVTVEERSRAVQTQVHFGNLSPAEIDAYVASGEPLEVAGAFTIDGLGGAFIDGVTGDPHSVVGISLPLLRELCAELGVSWPQLWTRPATE